MAKRNVQWWLLYLVYELNKKQTLPYVRQNNVRIVVKSLLYYLMIIEKKTCQIEYTVKIKKYTGKTSNVSNLPHKKAIWKKICRQWIEKPLWEFKECWSKVYFDSHNNCIIYVS